jgi:signal transduction histidine kinase/DNA-binding NarL/FixJ family response regulator
MLLAESWVVFKYWRGRLNAYLFLGCIATLINNIGYLMELTSHSQEAYFTALKMSYLGRVWISFALLLFIAELIHVPIPKPVVGFLAFASMFTYVIVVTTEYTGLYYKSVVFRMEGDFPVYDHQSGIWHNIWTAVMALYILVGVCFLVYARRKAKSGMEKSRMLMVLFAVLIQGVLVIIQMLRLIPFIGNVYDITMLSFPIAAIFMFIAIVRYDLLDTERLAKDYVIDELSQGIIATDQNGKVIFFNKPAVELFPKLTEEPREVVDFLKESIKSGTHLELGDRMFSPIKNTLYQNRDKAGSIYALIDDTEQYHYMEELKEQRSIADHANRAKSVFLANMSHEIRTPINAVLGMDEMILRETAEPDTRTYAEDIRRAGQTLLSLVNDILDLSKIEQGKMEILPTRYEMASLLGDLINMIAPRIEAKGLGLEVQAEPGLPHLLLGDEIRIRQIILNLLTNAVKYTEKGRVRLDIGFKDLSDRDILLQVRVSDTGIGMKEEDIEKLFVPYTRLEEERNRAIEGTGLGMSIVQQLLFLMGSRLQVESVYGAGSVFSFEIRQEVISRKPMGDVSRFTSRAEKSEEYRELFHAPDARILVVDDTEVNLTVMTNLLKRTKVRVDKALSGKEALALTEKTEYDIIFIDHMMPEMDGIEVLHRMQEQRPEAYTVYIVLTANAITGAREMYLEEGFADYVSKPVNGRKLEEMILKYLQKEKILKKDASDSGIPGKADGADAPKAGGSASEESIRQEIRREDSEPETSDPSAEIPEWLYQVEDLNPADGILNCGSEDGYLPVLEVFHKTAESNAEEIDRYYREGDLKNYTIKVHALKSSARIIGAAKLSELALELEMAGKEENMDRIRQDTGRLLEMYRTLDNALKALDPEEEDLKELPDSMRKEAFQTISEITELMDYGMMEGILKDLRGYRLKKEDADAVSRMEKCLLQLDWDGIRVALQEIQ